MRKRIFQSINSTRLECVYLEFNSNLIYMLYNTMTKYHYSKSMITFTIPKEIENYKIG